MLCALIEILLAHDALAREDCDFVPLRQILHLAQLLSQNVDLGRSCAQDTRQAQRFDFTLDQLSGHFEFALVNDINRVDRIAFLVNFLLARVLLLFALGDQLQDCGLFQA